MAAEEERVDRDEESLYRGFCINATSEYLTTLANSGLAPDALGTELATYVVKLTELLNDRACRPDSEIPQAIAMTGEASRDPEQQEQIRLIALTVFDCNFTTTASIAAVSFDESSSDGPSAGTPPSNDPPAAEPPSKEPPVVEPPSEEPPAVEPPTEEPPITPPGGEVPGYEDGPGTPASQA